MKKLIGLWTPVVLWAGLIFYISSIPSLDTGWGIWDLILRKSAHMIEFAILAILLWRALSGTKPMSAVMLARLTLIVTVAYAASDEFHQSFVPGRGPSVWDVVIDSAGGYLAILFRSKAFS